jgi:hypothetical protein
VLLQDRDAACTGAEVARWTLHVEEAPPAEERRPTPDNFSPARNSEQLALPAPYYPRKAERKASDRRAAALLRERGIDPAAQIADDPIPF